MNEEIKSILDNLKVNNVSIPVEHINYTGSKKTFVTWILLDEEPSLSANDEDLFSVCPIDIDVFSDSDYLDIVKEIKKIMKNNEWVWTGDSAEMYEKDTGLYHRTITFEKERMI